MAKIVAQESIRQATEGARAFGTPRERPVVDLAGKKWLVKGGYVTLPGGEQRYMSPSKIAATFGLDRALCVFWHEGEEQPKGSGLLRLVTPFGITDWGRESDDAAAVRG